MHGRVALDPIPQSRVTVRTLELEREAHQGQSTPAAVVGLGDDRLVVGRDEQGVRRREGHRVLGDQPGGYIRYASDLLQPLHAELVFLGKLLDERKPSATKLH